MLAVGLGLFFVFNVLDMSEINSKANLPRLIFSFWKNCLLKPPRDKGWNRKPGSLEMLLGVCYIEIDDFKNARLELKKAIDFGKEKEANPWLSYIESTEGLRAAASR